MKSKSNGVRAEKEIQVYKNDFYSGLLMLTRKLFML